MRRLLPVIAALLLALPAGAGAANRLEVRAAPVALDPDAPQRTRVGRLLWRGGLELTARDPRFGGFSALLIDREGAHLLAVTDEGRWLTARLERDAAGTLTGLGAAVIGALPGRDGQPLEGKRRQDAESLARLPDGGLLVGFERKHRIWRYPAGSPPFARPPERWPAPKRLHKAPNNGGLEALVALDEGAVLAITENQPADDGVAAYLRRGGAWSELTYVRSGGYRPTGAARLPDGDLVVLERRFAPLTGVTTRLVRIPAAAVAPGARLVGAELAHWGLPLTVDNFEGVATGRGPDGETLIYLISDDNFSALQRTLLVVFALDEG